MKRISELSDDRLPFLVTAAVFLLMLAFIPLVLRMDDRIDSNRPMYMDMLKMQTMQQGYFGTTGTVLKTRLSDGKSLTIGENVFTPSAGVTISVREPEDGVMCINASNDAGAKSQRCIDPSNGEVVD